MTNKFVEEILEQENETVIMISEKLHDKMRDPVIRTTNNMIDLIQNLADPINPENIRPELLQSIEILPHLHQYTFDSVKKHYYYYTSENGRTALDRLVYFGTGFITGPIPNERTNLYNIPIDKTHLLIDDEIFIYDTILDNLGAKKHIADLSFKKRFSEFLDDKIELIELHKHELEKNFELKKEEIIREIDEKLQDLERRRTALLDRIAQKIK